MSKVIRRVVALAVGSVVEMLESRRLMTTAALTGTTGNDAFTISFNAGTQQYSFSGGVNVPAPVAASDLGSFSVSGAGGSDTLTIEGGSPTLSNDVSDDGTNLSIEVTAGSILNITSTEHLSGLTIDSGAAAIMQGNGSRVLVTNSLTIAESAGNWLGVLDLADNDLVVHHGDLPTLNNQIESGFNPSGGDNWQGQGITSSAAANDSTHLTALGVIQNSTTGTPTGSALYTSFASQTVVNTDVLVGYTYFGDANLDGQVNGSDYSEIDNGFNTRATGWINGDFNYDGSVNGSDYILIDNTFNTQGSPIVDVSLTAVANSTDSVTLNWTPSADAAYYRVYRSTTTSFDQYYSDVSDQADVSFDDDNLDAGTAYNYWVYSINTDGSTTKIGQTTIATPTTDVSLDGSPDAMPGIQPLASTPPASVTNLNAIGVNDSEIFVSWTGVGVKSITGYDVEISTDQVTWNSAGQASRSATNFIIRGYGTTGSSFLAENTTYHIRVTPINKTGRGTTSGVVDAQVHAPDPSDADPDSGHDMIIVVGGNDQTLATLLKGISVGGPDALTGGTNADSVGFTWFNLVNRGYNAYITADPADGGVPGNPQGVGASFSDGMPQNSAPTTINATNYIMANDASGRIYDEINQEALRINGDNQFNDPMDIGLIGYSHGGGMIFNLSQKILKDGNLKPYVEVVFAATIDAVQYDPVANSSLNGGVGWFDQAGLITSPLKGWTPSQGYNWYETRGYVPVTGIPGTGAYSGIRGFPFSQPHTVDTLEAMDDHHSIGVDFGVLTDIVSDANTVFGAIFH